ncbi:helix-turn-helix domain-containing protein [Sphingobacterium siyangense]|uniref:helix-turn-helix domain-containing protein n=1 Tax=Sphingobacterium siyangense TaxID=459529 RepID=UPI002FDD1758
MPDQIHYPSEDTDFEAIVISFSRKYSLVDKVFTDIHNGLEVLPINEEDLEPIRDVCTLLLLEYGKDTPDEHMLKLGLHMLLHIRLRMTARKAAVPENDSSFKLFVAFSNLIDRYFIEYKSVEEYAVKLNITSGYLNDIVKGLCGRSPKTLILERILTEAKRLLYFENLSVKEIAFHLHFNEVSYFNTKRIS